jgi:hypothetical protein
MPTRPDIFVGVTIPILSISIVPITIVAIITHPQTGDTRTIASPFARTTNQTKLGTRAGTY